MKKIQIGAVALLVFLSVVSLFEIGLASPNTVPAFLWSPHLQSANGELDEAVNYQVMSAKDLVGSVFTQGGWSNFLCSEKKLEQPVDVALVFIGRELLSSDVSSKRNSDPALVNTLNNLFTASNFSLAFPYIAAPEEERMENLLLSGLKEACPNNVGVSNIVFSDSCFVEDGTIQKLSDLQSFKDHLLARRETRKEGETDLVVLCSEGSESNSQAGQSHSERESILELVSSVEQSGSKYTALYVSDPYWYTSYKTLQRFLAETAKGNSTPEIATGCDELCKFKSSLLEGILVGIVFLLILISGLCCMAGIDTPTRFETPQDS
uniref:V-type proton ATPase subunit S1/VOA1 transmembrane domain-containing protein n=1 Tax=Arabidopsis thaliana TaxID=3702 RepID=Q8H7I0_ARATH|nr:unknown [Arabidopsis thaliana]